MTDLLTDQYSLHTILSFDSISRLRGKDYFHFFNSSFPFVTESFSFRVNSIQRSMICIFHSYSGLILVLFIQVWNETRMKVYVDTFVGQLNVVICMMGRLMLMTVEMWRTSLTTRKGVMTFSSRYCDQAKRTEWRPRANLLSLTINKLSNQWAQHETWFTGELLLHPRFYYIHSTSFLKSKVLFAETKYHKSRMVKYQLT